MPTPATEPAADRRRRTAAARRAHMQNAADRAVDDPQKLARAARIVRRALERQALSLDELVPRHGEAA